MAILSQTFVDGKNRAHGKGLSEALDLSKVLGVYMLASTHRKQPFMARLSRSCCLTAVPYSVKTSLIKSIAEFIRRSTVFTLYLLRLVESKKVDLVRADNATLWGISAYLIRRLKGTPYVLWLGALEEESILIKYGTGLVVRFVSKIVRFVERVVISNASLVLCVSKETLARAQSRGARRAILTPNYVDPFFGETRPEPKRISKNEVRFVYAGRLEKEKGLDLLMDAAKLLDVRNDFHITIAGEGTLKPKVVLASSMLHNLDYVGLLSRPAIRSLFWSSDALVLPSRTEGLPSAMLEAMSTGTPILAASVGEIPSVVTDGREGKLVDGGNLHSLLEGLLFFLDNKQLIRKMGERAKERMEGKAEEYINMHISLYQGLCV